jgi:hypothetical protein
MHGDYFFLGSSKLIVSRMSMALFRKPGTLTNFPGNLDHSLERSVAVTCQRIWLSKSVKIRIYKSIIYPVVLIGCETWSETLR